MMIAKKILFSGHVQGVGFRYSAKRLASGFDVLGSVRNLEDGRVEMKVMSDDPDELEDFIEEILQSDLGGFIKEHEITGIPPMEDVRGFVIES